MYEKEDGIIKCKNRVDILKNGDIVFPNRDNLTIGYQVTDRVASSNPFPFLQNFCFSLNMASMREKRGRYMVDVCLPEDSQTPVRGVKFVDYSKCKFFRKNITTSSWDAP